ncbi:hypothetical protein DRE_05443 [Drechslerella stenobrocha 248]|uniref:Piwi domain-containing protein n=1 Tax=Drechslerella stenobrocha 248 TaxID=1043628 RepID=W7I982_9PEZI|nr:hypothetical protein DRE_05443 [Drechslerella stenobrocha 248]
MSFSEHLHSLVFKPSELSLGDLPLTLHHIEYSQIMASTQTPSSAPRAHLPQNFSTGFQEYSLYPRPGFGKKGRPAKIFCNSYKVTRFPTATIHQYDVQITGKGDEKRATLRKVWYSRTLQRNFGNSVDSLLYDGNRLAWSIIPLPFGEELNIIIDLDDDDTSGRPRHVENKFRVRIRKTARVPLQCTEAYVQGKYKMDNDVLVGFNFLDHLLRETPAKHFITIKRSFFKHAGSQRLDGGVEAWKGIFQSIRPGQGNNLTINVDVAAAVFWTEGTVIACIQNLLRINSPEELINRLKSQPGRRELSRVKKVQFYTKHRKADKERPKRFTIEGFTKNGAREEMFDVRDRETGHVDRLSVETYYHKNYNIRLRYPQLPLIQTKKKNVLFPMELAFIVEGQRYPYKLDERQTSDMIRFTVQRPNIRLETIKKNVQELNWKDDPVLQKYGLTINPNMIQTSARVLDAPKICYGVGSQDATFAPRDGRWDLRGKKFARTTTLKSWAIGIAAQPRRVPLEVVRNFVRQFVVSFVQHGGTVETKEPPIIHMDPGKDMHQSCHELYTAAGNASKARPQIIFFILTAKSAHPYNDIKAACETQVGVVSQCLQSKHVEQAKAQYCSNVCMKVNAKLGGTTVYLDRSAHPFWGQEPTMYIGADVSHGGAYGSGGMKAASFASMVGSIDLQGARYSAICNVNGERVEAITTQNIMRFMPSLLKNYRRSTNQVPRRIIYFRDGVSEGEYQKIIDEEVLDMKRACTALDSNYEPRMTVIVCTKRHHSRFFPVDKNASDRNGNIVPGTVVEKDITHVTDFDFFLCSHSAIQGTARATRYTVIMDENKIDPDRIQGLIYNMCYTYMRATNSVSLVPAVYYAHLASARARAHEIGGLQRDRERALQETTPSGSQAVSQRPVIQSEDIRPLMPQVADAMWYI